MLFSSFFSSLTDPDNKFNRFMSAVWDLLYLNLLFFVTSLPILTGGTSAAALYYAYSKVIYHKRSYITREFFHSWRQNLRQGIGLQLIFLFLLALAVLDLHYAATITSNLRYGYMAIGVFGASVLFSTYLYVFPLLSRVTGTVRTYIFMSLKLAYQHLLPTIPLLLLLWIFLLLTIWIPPLLFVLPSIFCKISCSHIEAVLRQHLNYSSNEPDDPWYAE